MSFKLPTEWYDNSKIVDFRERGDRYYFFKHERGWVPPESGIAADWGTAWHASTEPIWEAMCGKEESIGLKDGLAVLPQAHARFVEIWDSLQPKRPFALVADDPELEAKLWDKSPLLARAMLEQYIHIRAPFFTRLELLGIETPFVVPLFPGDDNVGFVGLIDRFVAIEGKHKAPIDLKTTGNFNYSRDTGIRTGYFTQYEVNSQPRGYVYGTRLVYNDDMITRAYIDASLRHRNKSEKRADIHKIHAIRYNDEQIVEWLHDTRMIVNRIREQRQRFMDGLPAWPRGCGEGCMKYGSCDYYNLCMTAEPVQKMKQPPNMIERFWTPIKLHQD